MSWPFFPYSGKRRGERLLKPGGRIIPAGGCQYATLVQLPDSSPWHPRLWKGFDLRRFTDLHDTLYWKARCAWVLRLRVT